MKKCCILSFLVGFLLLSNSIIIHAEELVSPTETVSKKEEVDLKSTETVIEDYPVSVSVSQIDKTQLLPDSAEIYEITANQKWRFTATVFYDETHAFIELSFLPSTLLGAINQNYFLELNDTKYLVVGVEDVLAVSQETLTLSIALPEPYFNENTLDYQKFTQNDSYPIDSSFINYDLTAPLEELSNYRGLFSLNYSSKHGWLFRNSVLYDGENFLRINTNWQNFTDNQYRITVGDTPLTAYGPFGAPNAFGFRYSSPFFNGAIAAQDSLPTLPLSGFAVTPSRLDLYINNRIIQQSDVDAGRYNMEVPIRGAGYGIAQAYLYDITGKPVIVEVPFYNSFDMIKAGKLEYDVSAGLARNNLGIESYDYGDMIYSGLGKYGVNDAITQDLFGVYTSNYHSVSTTSHFVPKPEIGVFHVGYSQNSFDQGYYRLGFDRLARGLSFGVELLKTIDEQPFCFSFGLDCLFKQERFFISGRLPGTWGGLNFTYINRENLLDQSKVNTLSYNKQLTPMISMFTNLNDIKSSEGDVRNIFTGISVNFDQFFTNTSYAKGTDGTSFQQGIFRGETQGHPEWGFGSYTYNEVNNNTSHAIFYGARLNQLRYQTNLFYDTQGLSGQLNVSGSAIFIADEGYLGFARQVTSAFAFVKVNNLTEPIRIDHENKFYGYTDKKGRLLVANSIALNNERITVDINHLPPGLTLDHYKREYFVPASGAVRVDFNAKPLPYTIIINNAPKGAIFNIGDDYYVVGKDGEASIDAEGEAIVPMPNGKKCVLDIKQSQEIYECGK